MLRTGLVPYVTSRLLTIARAVSQRKGNVLPMKITKDTEWDRLTLHYTCSRPSHSIVHSK